MQDTFITGINIKKVRHLENVEIPLSQNERKHLILTGKNGSGKTSLLEAMRDGILLALNDLRSGGELGNNEWPAYFRRNGEWLNKSNTSCSGILINYSTMNHNPWNIVNIYIPAARKKFDIPKSIETVNIKGKAIITRDASKEFLKYILSLDYQLYGAQSDGNTSLKANLEKWFDNFQSALCNIYSCPDLQLKRDTKNFAFVIHLPGHEPFGLHEMSDGYAAFLDIYMELLMRMENDEALVEYENPAIVLIDEIETHLHVELQKRVLPFLTRMFPNTQFIVSTHSPFVITSLENSVVFDLEEKEILENPSLYSYETIVESFLDTSTYSFELKRFFQRYKELCFKERTAEENEEFLRTKTKLELMSPASKELYLAFNDLEEKRKAAKNG